ncbi:hypothetical protein FVB32_05995 [Flagellimonas hymeniacidonis]|uniref:Uncharacterized protein n=1 Tax=Flagellimonas hymeniacidonis TaxID=2603628 RepID=A0A5C8V9G0_9FLAO|nr:hypothetical protein [Flagellimonas hymeniacidonis]TXN37839.1 hypothetical protein FVB32_05995 [Flagellimonas hymeniacidonis]
MKTLFVFLITITSMGLLNQETETMKATFDGYVDGIYFFTDKDDFSNEFVHVEKGVLEQFDLTTDEFKGKLFVISYTTDTEEDDEGDEITTNTITDLKLVE